jgi:Flp pilus assembly protein TadG
MRKLFANRRGATVMMFAVFAAVLARGLIGLSRQMQAVMVSHIGKPAPARY